MARPFRNFVPYRFRPKCFFDCETTGVVPGFHEITEMAFKHSELGMWSIRIRPKYMERAQDRALVVSRYNEADWTEAPSIEEVWPQVIKYLCDVIIIGHNVAGFDMPMVEGEGRMKGLDTYDLSRAWEDTQGLAMTHLVPRGLKRVSLKACCDYYGIDNQGQHNALEDVLRCEQVYNRITHQQQEMF